MQLQHGQAFRNQSIFTGTLAPTQSPQTQQSPQGQQFPNAHVRPLVNGNLNVPEGAKFSKRQQNPENFAPELQNLDITQYVDVTFFSPIFEVIKNNPRKFPENSTEIIERIRTDAFEHMQFLSEVHKNGDERLISKRSKEGKYPEVSINEDLQRRLDGEKQSMTDVVQVINNILKINENQEIFNLVYSLSPELKKYFENASFGTLARSIGQNYLTLFPAMPSIEDIRQTSLRDCYLISALMSIISSKNYGPEFIMNMMRDNGDGTVTVRLYKPHFDKNGNAESFEPKFYIVNKTEVYKNSKSSLWVQMIEKAYAIGGFNNMQLKAISECYCPLIYRLKSKQREINQLESGNPIYALMAITGVSAKLFMDWWVNPFNGNVDMCDIGDTSFFNLVKLQLENNNPITFSHWAGSDLEVLNDYSSSSESIKIYKYHVYSVIDTFEQGSENYITLINPWIIAVNSNGQKERINVPVSLLEANRSSISFDSML